MRYKELAKLDYVRVPVVDGVMDIVRAHRRAKRPIRRILLNAILYDQYITWVQHQLGRPLATGEEVCFDNVLIEKGHKWQKENFYVDLFPENAK